MDYRLSAMQDGPGKALVACEVCEATFYAAVGGGTPCPACGHEFRLDEGVDDAPRGDGPVR